MKEEKIKLEELPLWLDDGDIFRIYLNCLNFIGDDVFEIVHEKNKINAEVSAAELIKNRISPKVSCKSKYGICLRSVKTLEDKKPSKRWILSSLGSLNFKETVCKLKIIKSEGEAGTFVLVPSIDMHLFQYKFFIEEFAKTFCQKKYINL